MYEDSHPNDQIAPATQTPGFTAAVSAGIQLFRHKPGDTAATGIRNHKPALPPGTW